MFKKFACFLAALITATAFAAVEANTASEAELDSIKGIGPSMSRQIMTARAQRPFKNWTDLIDRLKGVGPKTAGKFSEQGLTVNGAALDAAAAAASQDAKQAKPKARGKSHARSETAEGSQGATGDKTQKGAAAKTADQPAVKAVKPSDKPAAKRAD